MKHKLIRVERYSDLSETEREIIYAHAGLDLEAVQRDTIAPLSAKFVKDPFSALQEAAIGYEGFVPEPLILQKADLQMAADRFAAKEPRVLAAFKAAHDNISAFHNLQKQDDYTAEIAGNTLGMKFIPFDRVALYVPGGKARYPSTVLMGVIPARIAGVTDITVMSPPDPVTKLVPDVVLAMAHLAGANRVLQTGGAQAIFSAAHGIAELNLQGVDFIYGPGNLYVSAAKTFVAGQNMCGIDSFAGPSEVLIIADETANARFVAHDLMAQAEHDENAQAILLTTSADLAERVGDEIFQSLQKRPDDERRKDITLASIRRNGRVLIVESLEQAMAISNRYAPEHLEIQTSRNDFLLSLVRAAGSVFVGDHAPVAAGDYYSGTNHILPTLRGARFTSGVSVYTFQRRITWQKLTPDGLSRGKDAISEMSRAEGLFAEHGYSVLTRFE